jgi:predicted dehydrogenase
MTEPLKIGLIGTGSISALHLRAMQRASEKVTLAAVCDVREEAARRFAAHAGVEAVFADAETMLREADIDAVDICASHHVHRDLALASAEAGKHVFLEKPMANSLEECREILAGTDRAGVTFMVGQQLRHVPSYVGVKRLIEAGELGRIWGARSDSWLPVVMSRDPENPAGSGERAWRLDGRQAGGGSMIWNAIHFIDLLRYFLGDAKRVFGTCWTDHPAFSGGAEDRAMATIEFESGAIGHISNSWTTRAPWTYEFMLLGDEGSVYTPPLVDGNLLEQHEAPAVVSSSRHDIPGKGPGGGPLRPFVPVQPPADLFSENPYANEIAHFADCCRTGEEPVSSGHDNLETMKILYGIYQSSREGRMIDLNSL